MTTPWLLEDDLRRLAEGRHERAYRKLGAHVACHDGLSGVHFAVVAPNATAVSVVGDFNQWNPDADRMVRMAIGGVWHRFVGEVRPGTYYKFRIWSELGAPEVEKADPFAFSAELRPGTASRVWDLSTYAWHDQQWLANRAGRQDARAAITIYEVHVGSWSRTSNGRWLTYRELADRLTAYVRQMGFTHVELLPISEHPFDGSWGYQTTGYYAPTSRFGTPDDFRYLVDTLHQAGVGVILDWVPGHFPDDPHGLVKFDGTHLYEYEDPRQGRHPEWHTQVFNLARSEVHNFLISNALFWLDAYHIDGLRVDAVASMLYLDYARANGEWVPNQHGGKENLDAVGFLRTLNASIYRNFPDVMTIAEESTAWPGVSHPTDTGGLGFGFKWNMGWMHDTLQFLSRDPVDRRDHMNVLTFSVSYAFSENFVLPLSHDEVVHGKHALVDKMAGDQGQRFANLRLLYGLMYGHPGKKLLFMGGELGQTREWDHDGSVDWSLEDLPFNQGLQHWVRDLNHLYRSDPRLHKLDAKLDGFAWADHAGHEGVVSFFRRDGTGRRPLLFVCHFASVRRDRYRIGVPEDGWWPERLNSDATVYGGSGQGNQGGRFTQPVPGHGHPQSVDLMLPPLSVLVFGNAW